MADGDGPHNFPSTISLYAETKRDTFADQRYKIHNQALNFHRKNLAPIKGLFRWFFELSCV